MFDAASFDIGTRPERDAAPATPVPATFVCRVAVPGTGWRKRAGDIHVLVIGTADGCFTQVCRLPGTGRDVFVERIFAGDCVVEARDWALRRFG